MPKIIDGLNDKILVCAKQTLLEQGYAGLKIREIARACEVAPGTVYNYFSSKDMLVAEIMLADWRSALEQMCAACRDACTVGEGLYALFKSMRGFVFVYRDAWQQYANVRDIDDRYASYRKRLVGQIADIVSDLLSKKGKTNDPYLPVFTAKMLLAFSMEDEFQFLMLEGIIKKLYE